MPSRTSLTLAGSFDFQHMTVEAAKNLYPRLWNTIKLALPQLSDEDVAAVASLVADTCSSCVSENRSCHCWNDE